ncbi:MAG: AAA family ATPase [Actinobacteria bacterium]|nr:AAA family ATPase [Actinomycetota bacterium]
MLDELIVHNLGLIPEARFEPGAGLVVITGETGAGKTLLLGALRLLTGEIARKDQIGPTGKEAWVEGRFIVDGEEHVVRRRVDASRSRAYVDGKMVPAGAIAEQFASLVDIVGQHDRNALAEPAAVRALIDGAFDVSGTERLDTYREAWASLQAIEAKVDQLGGDQRALQRERDVVQFQATEISEAGFNTGDDVDLGRLATRLRNAESLGERLAAAARKR